MRMRIFVMLLAVAFVPSSTAAAPGDDEAMRDPMSILFEGAASFDARQLRKRLALDIDIQVAAHPNNPLSEYLTQLEQVLVSGYRASGFPRARAVARFDA